MSEDVTRETSPQPGSAPPGADSMMKYARESVPLTVDQFLIQATNGLIRMHFFDSAGNEHDPIHRTSIVVAPEQAWALKEVLTSMFAGMEKNGPPAKV